MKSKLFAATATALLVIQSDRLNAAEFQPLGKAIAAALGGATQALKGSVSVGNRIESYYYTKDGAGKAEHLAFVQKRVYEPNCTHTWVVGINAKSKEVERIETVEMACPHAFPTKTDSFLSQFKGKGPADAQGLEKSVDTVAKATGSSRLAANAVATSLIAASKIR